MKYKVVFLASEGGGNFKTVVERSDAHNYIVTKLIVNRQCGAVEKAHALRIPCDIIPLKGQELFEAIDSLIPYDTNLLVLGGFMPIVPEWFCNKWYRKIINIHPSLLPAYGGKGMYGVHVQESVMASKEEYAGCTVHYVEAGVDTGEVIEQWKIKIDYSLTPWELGGEIFFRGAEMLPYVIDRVCKEQSNNGNLMKVKISKANANNTGGGKIRSVNLIFTLGLCGLYKSEIKGFLIKSVADFPIFCDNKYADEYASKLSKYAKFIVLRDMENRIVAMIAAYINKSPMCYISHVCVLDEYKHSGLFKMMFTLLETKVKLAGCNRIKLEVKDKNFLAIDAYIKSGFEIVGKASDDSVYMQKQITRESYSYNPFVMSKLWDIDEYIIN